MIAILPWVDRVICSSKVDILSSLSTAGRKDMLRDVHGIDIDLKINPKPKFENTQSEE